MFLGFIILVVMFAKRFSKPGGEENLDFVFTPAQVAKKQDKTLALLRFLAQQDSAMAPESLKTQAESVFLEMQRCWQAHAWRRW